MRMIDAKSMEKQIKEAFDGNPFLMGMLLRWVRKQPSVDAVPVVRCKDCIHKGTDSWCDYVDDDNFYCARGERKDGEG